MSDVPGPDDAAPPSVGQAEWLRQQIELIDRRTAELQATVAAAQQDLHELHARAVALRSELSALLQPVPRTTPQYPPPGHAQPPTYPPPGYAPPPGFPPPGYPPPPPAVDADRPETSTRTVQNVLFVLGGLLLGTAAIAFTAVAWATFGETGRATALAIVTLIMLGIPLVALARGLRGTAETFALLGLLLVILDGYALWYIDIGGVQSIDGARYAGIVALVTAAVALAYRLGTRLAGPGFAAVVVVQPVLVLLVQPSADWAVALVAAAVAAFNVAVIALNRTGSAALRVLAWVLLGLWLTTAALSSIAAEAGDVTVQISVTQRVQAGTALVVTALVFLAAGLVTRRPALLHLSSGALVVAVGVAVGAGLATALPDHDLLLLAAVAALISLLVAAIALSLPVRARPGPRVGALIVTAAVALGVLVAAGNAAADTVARSFAGDLGPTGPHPPTSTWELPAAAMLVALGFGVAARARTRIALIAVGGLLAIVSLPDAVALPWWAPAPIALAAAALALGAALAGRTVRTTLGAGGCGAILLLFAVLTAQTRPALSAWVLAGVAVLGLAVAAVAAQRPQGGADRLAVGGLALVVAVVGAPAAVGEAVRATGAATWWAARASVIALAFGLAVVAAVSALTRRGRWPAVLLRYAYAGLGLSAIVWPAVAAFTGHESRPVYAAVSLAAIALGLAMLAPTETSRLDAAGPLIALSAAMPGAAVFVVTEAPVVLSVVGGPYAWLRSVWSGAPGGVGILPAGLSPLAPATVPDAVALAVFAVASAAAHFVAGRTLGRAAMGLTIGGPTAVIVGVVAAGAVWPAVPATTVLIGLILVVVAGVAPLRPSRAAIAAGQGIVYCGAGLAGALSTRWSTLVWLGALIIGAAVLAAIGRTLVWRVAGWLAAAAFALTLAAAAGFAADLLARQVAFAVLGAALLLLFGAAAVGGAGRVVEARALQAAAHAGGIVALLFTIGYPGYASAVSVMWGIALGLRALVPGTTPAVRARLAAIGAGFELLAWWLLLWARDVTLVEAFTLPLALVALLAGWAALRARPDLRSWVAYGPALAAGFLPSLALIISVPGSPWRRLGLGAAALAVVILGAMTRRQAPFVIAGVVLVIVALHELVLLGQLLPGWIPLLASGIVLVGLAITYERRRRDLARLRAALARMT